MQTEIHTEIKDEKLYDLSMIELLCRGKQEKVKKMVEVFIEEIPKAVREIKSAYSNNDFTTVRNVAHRIKPTLSYYAIVKIEKDIKQMEKLAEQGAASTELELIIKKLETVIDQIIEQMKSNQQK
jgi:HPt (histidine-containing phosphotransfer) domain-containing protein